MPRAALGAGSLTVDKSATQAGRNRSHTPENHLHLVDLLGGWPGALIAQQHFRHKMVKRLFRFTFWLTVAVDLAACAWLLKVSFRSRAGSIACLVTAATPDGAGRPVATRAWLRRAGGACHAQVPVNPCATATSST